MVGMSLLCMMMSADGHTTKGYSITAVVNDIGAVTGKLRIALFLDEQAYDKREGAQGLVLPVTQERAEGVFSNVPSGDVLVLLFHDVNGNDKLDTNFLGVPREPYASSTGKRGRFGPPSWLKGKVAIQENTTLEISLR